MSEIEQSSFGSSFETDKEIFVMPTHHLLIRLQNSDLDLPVLV
jgi:hypothetical protein